MSIRLEDALTHPTLAAADPVIRAAARAAGQAQLRWIHSSEIIDIAPLLAGGELLHPRGTGRLAALHLAARLARLS